MSFSHPEWALMQTYYSQGDITFTPITEKEKEEEKDDKPEMRGYEQNRVEGGKHFKAKEWEKALYYFEEAAKDKPGMWITGRINKCKKELDENNSNR